MTVLSPVGTGVSDIRSMPAEDRPRERLIRYGPGVLSDGEVLAILLRTGVAGTPVLQLAYRLLQELGGMAGLSRASVAQMRQLGGIGAEKAASLAAAVELSRRCRGAVAAEATITSASSVADVVWRRIDPQRESVLVLCLRSGKLVDVGEVAVGTTDECPLVPREVFRPAVRAGATHVIVAHNHPSGELRPSAADRQATAGLAACGQVLGIPLLDHVIVAADGYFSFCDSGMLHGDPAAASGSRG